MTDASGTPGMTGAPLPDRPAPPPPSGRRPKLSLGDVALTGGLALALGGLIAVAVLAANGYLAVDGAAQAHQASFSTWSLVSLFGGEGAAILGSIQLLLIWRRGLTWAELGLRSTQSSMARGSMARGSTARGSTTRGSTTWGPTTWGLTTRGWLLIGVVTGLVLQGALAFVADTLDPAYQSRATKGLISILVPNGPNPGRVIGLLLTAGIIAPFAEEVLFRGVLYTWLRQRWGMVVSVFASALLFAAAHVDPALAAQVFVIGLALAYLYEISGSILPAMAAHMTVNIIALLAIFSAAN